MFNNIDFIEILWEVFRVSLLVTSFVFVMMMLVEFINIATKGFAAKWLSKGNFLAFFLIGLIATTPGCLGGFTAVALFIHGVISRGMLVGSMIASSGDEAFFMLAMMPKQALFLFVFLLFYGILIGALVDKISGRKCFLGKECVDGIVIHEVEKDNFKRSDFSKWSVFRTAFLLGFLAMFASVLFGIIGDKEWNWERFALIFSSFAGFLIVLIASDHFLEEHIFHHIVKRHILKLFLWTFAALLIMEFIKIQGPQVEMLVKKNELLAVLIASLIGMLPESGPHLIFVMGFINGIFPFSTLVASSVVQDGHGMLPLLAESKKEFIKVKIINFAAGIFAGIFFMFLNF
ncbi:MAG: arsenic efflux protein [Thermoanaerobaculaceae bacterium]|nr:arsenic efflux protein [Thermoanaerobaculaceae bacterium]